MAELTAQMQGAASDKDAYKMYERLLLMDWGPLQGIDVQRSADTHGQHVQPLSQCPKNQPDILTAPNSRQCVINIDKIRVERNGWHWEYKLNEYQRKRYFTIFTVTGSITYMVFSDISRISKEYRTGLEAIENTLGKRMANNVRHYDNH